MKVIEALKKDKPALSFEFYPPKTKEQEERLFEVIAELKNFNPDYVSVTCGALGSSHQKTFFWVKEIKERFGIEPVAHLTCVSAGREEVAREIDELEKISVFNVLALRGDPPEGEAKFIPPADGFHYAKELVAFIKRNKPKFCLGVAGYPEGHPESPSLEKDIEYLEQKIEAGADYIVTQLFFDNHYYFDFLERFRNRGVKVPVIPGIMPITNYKLLRRMTEICGATIPGKLLLEIEKHKNDQKSIQQIGVEHAVFQCQELLDAKIPGIHFFVMNQAGPVSKILGQLKSFRQQ